MNLTFNILAKYSKVILADKILSFGRWELVCGNFVYGLEKIKL